MGIFCLSVIENVDQHNIKKRIKEEKKRKEGKKERKKKIYIDRITKREEGTITLMINLIFHNKCKKNLSFLFFLFV